MIIKNCPAIENIYEMTGDYDCYDNPIMTIDTPNYCVKHKKTCDKVENCIIKKIVNFCWKPGLGGFDETADKIIDLWEVERENA